jgi:hypothetical protein
MSPTAMRGCRCVAMTGSSAGMCPTEYSTGGVSAPERIVRDTQLLPLLVQALPAGQDVTFRAIHAVASWIMQAADDG